MLSPIRQQALAEAAKDHVAASMHLAVALEPWPCDSLPAYLTAAYSFTIACVGEQRMLWVLTSEPVAIPALRKHLARIGQAWSGTVAMVFADLPAYARQRLVAAGIPFVVPARQLYLPALGVDLRERTRTAPQPRGQLRPTAQALLLWLLYRGSERPFTTSDVVAALGFTRMTASRATGELEALGAIQAGERRRPRAFKLAEPPEETWEAMLPRLRTPVARTSAVPVATLAQANAPLAGLSALAQYTELAAPTETTRALASPRVREIAGAGGQGDDEGAVVLEAWTYDPILLTAGPAVDRLSLYLALREDPDERVQQALRRMLSEVGW